MGGKRKSRHEQRRGGGAVPTVSTTAVSVIVTERGLPGALDTLLAALDRQSFDRPFEVFVVDVAPERPRPLEAARQRFALAIDRPTDGASLTRAWNRALASATAPCVLLLEATAEPSADLLAEHLRVHGAGGGAIVAQGYSRQVMHARAQPADDEAALALDPSGVPSRPLDLATMIDGRGYDWRCVTTDNVSFDRLALLTIDGFDDEFCADGIGAGMEAAYRLQRAGLVTRVEYCRAARSTREEPVTIDQWLAVEFASGIGLGRIASKHDDPAILWFASAATATARSLVHELQMRVEAALPTLAPVVVEAGRHGLGPLLPAARGRVVRALASAGTVALYRGLLQAWTGRDPAAVILHGPPTGALTSVIVLSKDALAMTQRCVAHLRRFADSRFPTQILVVDNGSTDGSREWLAAEADIELIANATNVGAPVARNQAIARARGEYVVFMDNDALVGPAWLERLHYHAAVDPLVGFVGPLSDRASHGQQLDGVPTEPAAVEAAIRARAGSHARKFRINVLLSSFCVMTRRTTLDRIGGFDPRFTPWGFEDDDITLRAHLAGLHNRVALDVLVQHLPYAGPKLRSHEDLLARNWRRFAGKWGLPPETPYGAGLSHFGGLDQRVWTAKALHVPLDAVVPDDLAALRPVPAGRLVPAAEPRRAPPRSTTPALTPPPAARLRCARPWRPADAVPIRPLVAPEARLQLSIIVPTYDRPDLIANLLVCLDRQTLEASAFEVIIVDDGSQRPVAVDVSRHQFDIVLLRQANAGPGAARNLAIAHCRAPLTLIFNDDAVPAADNLAQHLWAHRENPGRQAVLGPFDFVERVRGNAFVELLERTSLLFDYVSMRDGATHGWTYFWTCNLSIATEVLRGIGGFDAGRFREAIVEDVELGYRLAKVGCAVRYHAAAGCGHDHLLTPRSYFRRMVRLGVNLLRMYLKHGDPAILWRPAGFALDDVTLLSYLSHCERELPLVEPEIEALEALAETAAGRRLTAVELADATATVRRLGLVCFEAGLLLEAEGSEVYELIAGGQQTSASTAVVILADGPVTAVAECLRAVSDAVGDGASVEIVVVAGEGVGLELDASVTVVECRPGASRGERLNLGVEATSADAIALLTSGARPAAGWLEGLGYHLAVDGRVACVSPGGGNDGGVPATAGEARAYAYCRGLSGDCLLVRRQVFEWLGGFDPNLAAAAPFDFTLRAHLAGFRNRVASGVTVAHLGQPASTPFVGAAWRRLTHKWGLDELPAGSVRALLAHVGSRTATEAELVVERGPAGPTVGERLPIATAVLNPASASAVRISLCVIARDEEATIAQCVASARGLVDEVIVVDTGSHDATVEEARAAGAKVYQQAWADDFSRPRNYAIEQATGDWILSLDADERLLADSVPMLRTAVASAAPRTAFLLRIQNHHDHDGATGSFVSFAPRLHPRDAAIRWRRPIHEQLEVVDGGPSLDLLHLHEPAIEHHGYRDEVMARKGKRSRNLALLQKAIDQTPDDALLLYCMGQTHHGAGDFTAAHRWLRLALEVGRAEQPRPRFLPYVWALAIGTCFELGRYDEGAALGNEPGVARDYPDLLCNLGACELGRGDLVAARKSFAAALALAGQPSTYGGDRSATTWRPLKGLGSVQFLAGEHAAALASFEEARSLAPGRTELRVYAAQCQLALGRIDEAQRSFAEVVAASPDNVAANAGLFDCQLAAGKVDEAADRMARLLASAPECATYRLRLADLLIAAGELEAAANVLGEAMEQSGPREVPVYVRLGDVLTRLGRYRDAVYAYAVAISVEPGNTEARQGLVVAQRTLVAEARV